MYTVTERICEKVILAVYCVVMTIMKGDTADLTQNLDFRHQNMIGWIFDLNFKCYIYFYGYSVNEIRIPSMLSWDN